MKLTAHEAFGVVNIRNEDGSLRLDVTTGDGVEIGKALLTAGLRRLETEAVVLEFCREVLTAYPEQPKPEEPPPWRDDRFTEEERQTMVFCTEEEIRDSAKEMAIDQLDGEDMLTCIRYCIDDDLDVDQLEEMLEALRDGCCDPTDLQSGEHEGHLELWQFIHRMKLAEDDGTLTDLGLQFINEAS